MISVKIVFFSLIFFNLLLLIKTEEEIIESVNYTRACEDIINVSKKDCTVAPRNNDHRCCYVSWENGDSDNYTLVKGRCSFIKDNKKELKNYKQSQENSNRSKVKIECEGFYNKFLLF